MTEDKRMRPDEAFRVEGADYAVVSFPGREGAEVKELTVKASVGNIPAVMDFVNGELERLSCPKKPRIQINIATDELFANIALYAYAPSTGEVTVRVEPVTEPAGVVISFIDTGVPFDPLMREDPDTSSPAEERKPGGLGIFLVKKTMDEMIYERDSGRNVLSIRKNF